MGSATVRQLLAAGDEPISMARGGTVTESGGLPREALPEQIVSLVQVNLNLIYYSITI